MIILMGAIYGAHAVRFLCPYMTAYSMLEYAPTRRNTIAASLMGEYNLRFVAGKEQGAQEHAHSGTKAKIATETKKINQIGDKQINHRNSHDADRRYRWAQPQGAWMFFLLTKRYREAMKRNKKNTKRRKKEQPRSQARRSNRKRTIETHT